MGLQQAIEIVENYGRANYIDSHLFKIAMKVIVDNRDRLPRPVVYTPRGAPWGYTFQALELFKSFAACEQIRGQTVFVLYPSRNIA